MTTGQRILVNALATYGRTLLAVFLGLFSSRLVLASLGEVDYGLLGVIAGILVFVTFLNTVSTAASARFFAFSIGKNDVEETRRWFNCALSIEMVLPTVLAVVGLVAGEYAIRHFLSIPADRLDTSVWVFRISLATAFVTMVCSPFTAMYTAKQNIAELSVWGMALSVSTFVFVLFFDDIPGDKWLIFSIGIGAITSLFTIAQSVRSSRKYAECTIVLSYWFDRKRLAEMLSFSLWTLLGAFGSLFYHNGLSIVLNKFFPPMVYPSVNASYSIGSTVAGHTRNVSGALLGAFMPEIVSAEGRGDRESVICQMFRATRLSFIIICLVVMPLLFQADFILSVWLVEPPEYAALFCRILLSAFLIQAFIGGFDAAICATGKIKRYQIVMSSLDGVAVGVAVVLLLSGAGLSGVCAVIPGYSILKVVASVYFCRQLVGISVSQWLVEVIRPVIITLAINVAAGFLLNYMTSGMSPLYGFLTETGVLLVTTSLCCRIMLIRQHEWQQAREVLSRLRGGKHALRKNKAVEQPEGDDSAD